MSDLTAEEVARLEAAQKSGELSATLQQVAAPDPAGLPVWIFDPTLPLIAALVLGLVIARWRYRRKPESAPIAQTNEPPPTDAATLLAELKRGEAPPAQMCRLAGAVIRAALDEQTPQLGARALTRTEILQALAVGAPPLSLDRLDSALRASEVGQFSPRALNRAELAAMIEQTEALVLALGKDLP